MSGDNTMEVKRVQSKTFLSILKARDFAREAMDQGLLVEWGDYVRNFFSTYRYRVTTYVRAE